MKIANCRGLLKVRYHNDQNCIKYFNIAAYHLNNVSLERDGRKPKFERTSPDKNSNQILNNPAVTLKCLWVSTA